MVTSQREITLSAEPLGLGETVRIHCPTCQGDRPTLTITRQEDGSVVWNCYRASCSERGGSGAHRSHAMRGRSQGDVPRKQKFHPYTGKLRHLEDAELEFLREKIGWDEDHVQIARPRYAVDEDRFAFPIFGPDRRRRGWVLRTWNHSLVRTKALTRMDGPEPHLSWYFRGPGPTVLVEDIPSAVRAAAYVNSVALCGTGVGPDYALEIAAHAPSVVWMLDEDATTLAVRHHRTHMALFSSSRVRPIPRDLKDMTEPELRALMEELV